GQAIGRLAYEVNLLRQYPLRLSRGAWQQVAQCPAADQFHGEIQEAAGLVEAVIIDPYDVRVLQAGQRLSFFDKTFLEIRLLRKMAMHYLDRHGLTGAE